MRTTVGLINSILSIGITANLLTMPGLAQSTIEPEIVTPTIIEPETINSTVIDPVTPAEPDNYSSQVNNVARTDRPCLKIDSNSKMYVQYVSRRKIYRDYVPNTPSDYSKTMAEYPYCG